MFKYAWNQPPQSGERMNVEEYFHLEAQFPQTKYELLGNIIRLMSGGSRAHDTIAFNIRVALRQRFQSGPCFASGSDMRVQLSESSYVFPDATVSCDVADRRRENTVIRSPRLVVEVLSPSTEKYDRTDKLRAYQNCSSIQEIVLVNQFAPHVEVFQRNQEDETTWRRSIYEASNMLLLESLDLSIPVEELYQDINFDEPILDE